MFWWISVRLRCPVRRSQVDRTEQWFDCHAEVWPAHLPRAGQELSPYRNGSHYQQPPINQKSRSRPACSALEEPKECPCPGVPLPETVPRPGSNQTDNDEGTEPVEANCKQPPRYFALCWSFESMSAQLSDMSGQYKKGREEEAHEKRTGDKGELEDQEWCWQSESFDVWRRVRPDLEVNEKAFMFSQVNGLTRAIVRLVVSIKSAVAPCATNPNSPSVKPP